MDSNYILTPSGTFISTDELYHHGILGMKWGVRRYQNSDGSLTAAGRKRYANPDGSLNEKGKKKFGNSVKTAEKVETASKSSGESASTPKRQEPSEMSDKELQDRVNRLRNEDAYKDLSKKLGYDTPKTELDIKIAEMEKQKRYLELERDIKNLTPKHVSKGQQMIDTLMKKVIEPAATEAGKKLLTQYLTEAGAKALGKTAKKEAATIEKSVKKSVENVKKKEAKEQAKAEAKAEKQAAKEQAKAEAKAEKQAAKEAAKEQTKVYIGSVEDAPKQKTSSSSSSNTTKQTIDMFKNSNGVYEYANTSVTDLATTRNTSAGRSWVAGYLSSGKDDDD